MSCRRWTVDPEQVEALRAELDEARDVRRVLAQELARCRGGSTPQTAALAERLDRAHTRIGFLLAELDVARAALHDTRAALARYKEMREAQAATIRQYQAENQQLRLPNLKRGRTKGGPR